MTLDLVQGSDEWKAARLGRVTASRISDVVAKTKTGYGAGRANYMAELLTERLTGRPYEAYRSAAMQWGTDTEEEARHAYAFWKGVEVETVGFVPHPTIAMSGASPDGLIGIGHMVEFKCPNTATHLDYLLTGKISKAYQLQIDWQLICTGREFCDFVSYDPRLPEGMKFFVLEMPRPPQAVVDELEGEVKAFLAELDAKEAALRSRYGLEEAA
jgi:putative phage-type endonuclease